MSVWIGRAFGGMQELDLAEVRRALAVLADPDEGLQLRGLPSGRTLIRPGRDLDALVQAARDLADDRSIYYGLNPVPADLGHPPRVADVLRRRHLLIDVDRKKREDDKELSATDAEHETCRTVARLATEWLASQGWPAPALVDSGNGWQLLYRVELPNDDPSSELVKKVLHALGGRFDTDGVEIDRRPHDAPRIAKLPGCWARKGPNLPERPHRPCRLVFAPERLEAVTAGQLGVVAGETPAGEADRAVPEPGSPFRGRASDGGFRAYVQRALDGEIASVCLAAPGERNNTLNRAAFYLGQFVGAKVLPRMEAESKLMLAASRCGLSEREARATIKSGLEAGVAQPRSLPERNGAHQGSAGGEVKKDQGERPVIYRITELLTMDLPEPRWAVPGLLSEGLSILAGKPKLGKSWMALNLALTIAAGGTALGSMKVEAGDVLYLSLEDRLRRVQDRTKKLLKGLDCGPSSRLQVSVIWPRQNQGGLDYLQEWLEQAENPSLVIIDVWAKFRPSYRQGSQYEQDYDAASAAKSIVDRFGASLLILHHCKKAQADDVVDEISGTLGLAGAADGLLVLTRSRGENEGNLFISGRDVEEKEMALEFSPQTFAWKSLGPTAERTESKFKAALIELFKRNTDATLRTSALYDSVGCKNDKERQYLRVVLGRMVGEGLLERPNEGCYRWPLRDDRDPFGDQ